MNKALYKITKIYHVHDRDWMNYRITKDNPLTYHHIKEKRNKGKKTVQNGAPLTEEAHRYLNLIEEKDRRLYVVINTMFELIQSGHEPITEAQRGIIAEVLNYYESNIKNYPNKKGKIMILKTWR